MQLRDKKCLLVGGTGGLGVAAARRFLEEGAKVVVAGLPDGAVAAQRQLSPLGLLACLPCDARIPEQVTDLFTRAIAVLGGLDVLYHLAGGSGRPHGDAALHDGTEAGWAATLATNLTSVFLTNRAAIQYFLRQGVPGVLLNLASALASSPAPALFDTAAYTAAKGGVVALSRYAAARYARDHIRVNVLAPGLIDTPMAQRACTDPAILAFLQQKQPLTGKPGDPAVCADAAVFLCSDAARWVTGAVLPVDGGWSVCDAGQ
jgi:NAD(P)-dependent dehydrogenase (short-subunit alcohol dehydrogenase family)